MSKRRAEVRRLVGWFDTKFYAEVSEPVLTEKVIRRFMPRESGGGSPEMARVRKGLDRLKAHLDYIGALADRRNWLAGDDLSLADLAAAAHLSAIDYLGDVPWADFPSRQGAGTSVSSRGRPSGRCSATACAAWRRPAAYADLDF